MNYFVLQIDEDGDIYLNEYTKEQLEVELPDYDLEEIAHKSPNGDIMGSAGEGKMIYIFKGELVQPFTKEVITKLELP